MTYQFADFYALLAFDLWLTCGSYVLLHGQDDFARKRHVRRLEFCRGFVVRDVNPAQLDRVQARKRASPRAPHSLSL